MSFTHIKYNTYLVVEVSHTKKLWPKTFTGWKYINSNINNDNWSFKVILKLTEILIVNKYIATKLNPTSDFQQIQSLLR